MRAGSRVRLAGVAAAVASVAQLLAGCGSSGSTASDQPTGSSSSLTSPPTSAPTSEEPPPSGEEGCPYLTVDHVGEALGAPVVETAGSLHACFFDPVSGGGATVMLSRVDVQIEPTAYATQTRALCHGEVTDVDAGDEAFACVMGLGPQGQLYVGRVLVTVNVNGADDDAAGIAVAKALLPKVTIPPEKG